MTLLKGLSKMDQVLDLYYLNYRYYYFFIQNLLLEYISNLDHALDLL